MLYDMDAERPVERVELEYVTSQTDYFHSPLMGGFKTHRVYDQRQEGFADALSAVGGEVSSAYGAEVSVLELDGQRHSSSRLLASAYEEKDLVRVTVVGPKEAISGFVAEVAERGYGLPQFEWPFADLRHPVQSFRGYRTASAARESLEERFVLEEAEEGGVRHAVYRDAEAGAGGAPA